MWKKTENLSDYVDVSGRLTSGEMCAGFRRQKEEEDGNIFNFFRTVFYEYS